ncbi:hypothetical protein LGR51_20405 [Pseudomonas sp. NP21570]|uniref:Lipoprotein n=1 Tax=Stutzerimonas stutzeri TaxID=316 RepID=A0A6I6LU21_STUST|nr:MULTISPECIES: hypothetical protein [Stutzerimonas]MCB4796863.1 hypothetical protein [Pseudomonas sp. NP21570]RRV23279.1 hypothetical protein EGJ29_09540 [Pseudomonas sp. s199]HDQ4105134.1 hypothetical protein [Pseudomonas aeruginosa]MCQ4257157.1 hypothetical protein [Stutzerimonas stutzeri]QGZ29821.1 hypothetical protein GQA94_07025 [Stutzerimonas stutzeri]
MKLLLRTFAAAFMFAGIFAGCLTVLLLVALMLRFPPLLVAMVLACWLLNRLQQAADKKSH